jgi:hypothetical protein
MRARGRLADAVRFHLLNSGFSPTSGSAFRRAAEAQLAAGGTVGAVASPERAVAINAND